MVELTRLESKLGQVTGLAMAAQAATERVARLAEREDDDLVARLEHMNEQALETEERCTELARSLDGKEAAILEEAQSTRSKASELMSACLGPGSDALDGLEFLTMAEAGEVAHWSVLATLNRSAGHEDLAALVAWALPIEQAHLATVLQGAVQLAGDKDPDGPASS